LENIVAKAKTSEAEAAPVAESESVVKAKAKLDSMEATALRVQTAGVTLGNAVRSLRKSLFPKLILLGIMLGGIGCTTVVKDDTEVQRRIGNLESRIERLEKR
jgi:hypothetical protein